MSNDKTEIQAMIDRKDMSTFNYLYQSYAPSLYGFICKTNPDNAKACEILEQSFVMIWHHLDRYDPRNEKLLIWMMRFLIRELHASIERKTRSEN